MERTLIIVKPDAVRRKLIGRVIETFEECKLDIVGLRMVWLTKQEAEQFYHVHKGKDFFEKHIEFMSSGPSVVMVLNGDNIIQKVRDLIGSTISPNEMTIRGKYATSITENIVHASDSVEASDFEVRYFFIGAEIFD